MSEAPEDLDAALFAAFDEDCGEDDYSPVDIRIEDYAVLKLRNDSQRGAMRCEIINAATGTTEGRGEGNLKALRKAWESALKQARMMGVRRLVADVYKGDMRGDTRMSVYTRVGWDDVGGGRIVYEL